MPGFDPSKDEIIHLERVDVGSGMFIELKLVSYNKGPAKIQLSRLFADEGVEKYRKLGRLSLEESLRVAEALPGLVSRAPIDEVKEATPKN